MENITITFITIILGICACLISLIIFIIILIHLFCNQTKKEEKVIFIFNASIMIFICPYGIIIISICRNTILGDLYGNDFQSLACILNGYLIIVFTFSIYSVFVSQVNIKLINRYDNRIDFLIFLGLFPSLSNCLFILQKTSNILALYFFRSSWINSRMCYFLSFTYMELYSIFTN